MGLRGAFEEILLVDHFQRDPRQFETLVRQVRHWPDRFTGRLHPR